MSPSEQLKKWSRLTIQSEPKVTDPRELQTILTGSLRALWGDLEPYSCLVEVEENVGLNNAMLVVRCPNQMVDQVRAALTLVTPPPYLEGTVYRFDVVNVQSE
jgi:RNase P/RNase MRP subunit POP5